MRRRIKRHGWLRAVTVTAIFGLAACAGGLSGSPEGDMAPAVTESPGQHTDAEVPSTGGVVTVDILSEPVSLDPLKYNKFAAHNIFTLVYDSLFRWKENGELEPELATGPATVSEDGLEVTIQIREGVKFHDGSDLTSEDVAFTIENVTDLDNGSIWYAGLAPITSVSTPDARTVELKLSRPHAVLSGILAQIPIISSNEAYVPTETYAQKMNGTGAFKFVEWKRGSELVLERNDDYYVDELPYLDGVTFRVTSEDAARIANITNGESDIIPMVPFDMVSSLNERDVNVVVTPESAMDFYLFPSMQNGHPTANADFRRAVAWAIDRGAIVDKVFQGYAKPASTIVSTTQYWNEELGNHYGDKPNTEEARAALSASGVIQGVELELVVSNEPLSIAVGTIIQSNLKDIGIDVNLSPEEAASYLPKLISGDADLVLLYNEVGIPSGFTLMHVYSALFSQSGGNFNGFADEELDKRLITAISDPVDPLAAWRAVQERELEVHGLIPTVSARYVEAYAKRLHGHTPSSIFNMRDLKQSWLEK